MVKFKHFAKLITYSKSPDYVLQIYIYKYIHITYDLPFKKKLLFFFLGGGAPGTTSASYSVKLCIQVTKSENVSCILKLAPK